MRAHAHDARVSVCMAWEGKGNSRPVELTSGQSHRILIAKTVCFPNPGYNCIKSRINNTLYSSPRQQHSLAIRRGAGCLAQATPHSEA